VSAGFF